MIDIIHIKNLAAEDSHYLFSSLSDIEKEKLDGIAAVHLVVKEPGFESMINEASELPSLLRAILIDLVGSHKLLAAFIELSPKKKSRLRSHKGILYGLKKQVPGKKFSKREFDIQNNFSQFGALLDLDAYTIPFFLENLLISIFSFGLILPEESLYYSSDTAKEKLLEEFFPLMVSGKPDGYVNYIKGIVGLLDLQLLLFRTTTDGQDNQYLEFYGPRPMIEAKIIEELIPHLNEKFYLRQQQA